MMDVFQSLFDWYMANLNYFTVALLMAIESTFLPLPSEVVVPFAAYKAGQGDLNVFLVVFFGTVGALSGSLINYTLAYYLGRPDGLQICRFKTWQGISPFKREGYSCRRVLYKEWQDLNIHRPPGAGCASSHINSCRTCQNESA